jgi:SAM-dependent methyltransferase
MATREVARTGGLKSGLARQFSDPQGLGGRFALFLMGRLNRGLNEWAVSRVDVGPGDRFLDIGSGPGLALEAAARRGASQVAGVDHSDVAARVAHRRLGRAKRTRIQVERAEARSLPFDDQSFDKVVSVNGIAPASGVTEALREAFRVLTSGGRLLLVVRTQREASASSRHFDRSSRFGASTEQIATLARKLEEAGFTSVTTVQEEVSGELMTAISATKSS